MKSLYLIFIALCFLFSLEAKTIKDMAGRSVTVPDHLERIMPYDVKTSVVLFPIASDVMLAKTLLPGATDKAFISPEYNSMPEIDMKNIESVLAAHPQVIIAGLHHTDTQYEKYEKLQKRTQIPVVIIYFSIEELDKTYLFLGNLLGKEEACHQCAQFIEQTFAMTDSLMASSPELHANVYYSMGNTGLMTDPVGSKHTEVLDYLKLNNVVKVSIPSGGHVKVNMEQVLVWNPDYIFTAGFKTNKNAYTMMQTNSRWKCISAVEKGNVYQVPSQPFGWFDHPPTVNRIPGVIWLSQLFYHLPAVVAQEQITNFYHLFYHYELTAEEYASLFN